MRNIFMENVKILYKNVVGNLLKKFFLIIKFLLFTEMNKIFF